MSHSFLFKRYLDGKDAPYDFTKLRLILEKHGAKVGDPRDAGRGIRRAWVEFPARDDGDDISGDEGGIYLNDAGVLEFAIGRPGYGDRPKRLAFELLQSSEMYAHPDSGDEIFTTHGEARHVPKTLLEICEKSDVTVVRELKDLW